jgi:hypothetical protein
MIETIHPTLEDRLYKLHMKYEKVTAFAKLLPLFSDEIINREYTGEVYCNLACRYKDVYFAWDITWWTNRPTNFPDSRAYESGVVCIYVNNMSMFNDALYNLASERLYAAMKDIPCYFYDSLNSTWYFKPDELENGLEVLNEWYTSTKAEAAEYLKQAKRKQLEAELEKLNA